MAVIIWMGAVVPLSLHYLGFTTILAYLKPSSSVGKHRCLGERNTLFEFYKTIFESVRRFDLANLDSFEPLEADINCGI